MVVLVRGRGCSQLMVTRFVLGTSAAAARAFALRQVVADQFGGSARALGRLVGVRAGCRLGDGDRLGAGHPLSELPHCGGHRAGSSPLAATLQPRTPKTRAVSTANYREAVSDDTEALSPRSRFRKSWAGTWGAVLVGYVASKLIGGLTDLSWWFYGAPAGGVLVLILAYAWVKNRRLEASEAVDR